MSVRNSENSFASIRDANSFSISGAEGSRGVVDDVAELLVLAVDVADDVNGALGKREDG